MTNPQDVTAWLDRIKFAHLNNETVIAESLALSAIEATNNAPAIREVAGMLAFDRGDYDQTMQLIESAMFEIPLSVTARLPPVVEFKDLTKGQDSVVIIRLEDGSLYRLQKTKFGKLLLSK